MNKLHIKIITAGLLAMLLSACGSSAYEYRKDRVVTNIDVALGETVKAGATGLSVMFNSVGQDSRCAINARCIWGGVGIVNATVINSEGEKKAIKLSTVNYETYNNVETVFGKSIELIDLLPKPIAGSGAKPEISQKLIKLKID
jgi:hypothetical protein